MPTSLSREIDVDVLVIGAGPAGLFATNALSRAGINVKVIDKRHAASHSAVSED
jgi:phenol 2-monooxygenase